MPPEPYISLVVAARNDDHGGNMLRRMEAMLTSWVSQSESLGLPSEIVVVEWNPPPDRPLLKDALSLPPGKCDVRFIEVSAELHARFPNAQSIPLHQMTAKNAGIRRARGEFVLATNLDIIFSADLMRFLAQRPLRKGVMYRMDRHDVASDLPASLSAAELLEFCEKHLRRVFAREGEFPLSSDGRRQLEAQDIVAAEAGIRFGRGWSPIESSGDARYRWIDEEAELFCDAPATGLVLDVEVGPSAGPEPVSIAIRDEAARSLAQAQVNGRVTLRLHTPDGRLPHKLTLSVRGADLPLTLHPRIVNLRARELRLETTAEAADAASGSWRFEISPSGPAFPWSGTFEAPSPFAADIRNAAFLHTNACGDFTLLSRDDWFALRGYPEFPIWPMHIDAMLCYAAHHAGIREMILGEPMRIYHVEHSTGAGWTPEGEPARVARLQAKGLREMSYATFTKWVDLMRRYDAPAIFTRENWGLGDLELPERPIGLDRPKRA